VRSKVQELLDHDRNEVVYAEIDRLSLRAGLTVPPTLLALADEVIK